MTRSPLAVTLLPLIPLAALAWPLASVLNQEGYQPPALTSPEGPTGPVITGYLEVQSAHPFESISVKIGEATWIFGPDEDEKEIHFPADPEIILKIAVEWPPDTPETAALIRLIPEGRRERSHTLWGSGSFGVTEEVKFTWEDAR